MKRSRLTRKTGMKRSKLVDSERGKNRRRRERKLDALCRELVVVRRDQNTCQRCGKKASDGHRIEWCHVRKRGAKSIQWSEWNTVALCGPRPNATSCHHWFDNNPTEAESWWATKWPERALAMAAWRQQRSRPKLDYGLIEIYLKQQLEKGA